MSFTPIQQRYGDYLLKTGGETVLPRINVTRTDVGVGSGTLKLMYFRAKRTEAITQLRVQVGATAGTAATFFSEFVYSVDEANTFDLTLISSSTSDTTSSATAGTGLVRTLGSTFNKVEGRLYAAGFLIVCSGSPTWEGVFTGSSNSNVLGGQQLTAALGSQTTVPSTIADSTLTKTSTNNPQIALLA